MNKITISLITMAVLATGSQAFGMMTKRGREIMAAKRAQNPVTGITAPVTANKPVQKAKIVLVPVSKPAPACSKEEYYNVRLPLINASKEAKKQAQGLICGHRERKARR